MPGYYLKTNKTLVLILLIATILRFIGTKPGFHPYHSDEGMSYSSAIEMIKGLNFDPKRYDYPATIPIIHTIIYTFLFIPLYILKSLILEPEALPIKYKNLIELWQLVVHQNQQTMVIFWGRYVTAMFSVGVVWLVYYVAKSIFSNKKVALIAAFLTATNFRQVLNSHLALPDIYNSFFLLLNLLCLSMLCKTGSLKNYIYAGITTGLFFSTKFQIYTLPVLIIVHFFITQSNHAKQGLLSVLKNIIDRRIIISCIMATIVVLLINHQLLLNWEEFQAINSYNLLKYQVGLKKLNLYPIFYLYKIGIGEIISILSLVGIAVSIKDLKKSSLLLIPTAIFFYIFIYYTHGGYYTRNFVSITPVLLIFSSLAIVALIKLLGSKLRLNNKLTTLLLLAVLALASYNQLKNSVINSYYYSKTWNFERARDWASVHFPEGAKVVSHPWDKYPRDKNLKIIPLETSSVFSLSEMQEEQADYGFVQLDWITQYSNWWINRPLNDQIRFHKKPDNMLKNTFSGMVGRELGNWSVAAFVKPWQAPDMNILIVKVPQKMVINEKNLLANFTFDSDEDLTSWSLIDGDNSKPTNIQFAQNEGHIQKGSLNVRNGIRKYPIIHAQSPLLPVKDKKAIIAEVWIKSGEALTKNKRDGLLALNFYDSKPEKIIIDTTSISTSLSARYYGDGNWQKAEIINTIPDGSKFVSASAVAIDSATDLFFDDIVIYESQEDFPDTTKSAPYIDYKIPDDILFPYSQAGL